MTLGSLGQGDRGGGEPAKGMWKSSCHLGLGSVLLDLQEPQNKPLIYLSEGVGVFICQLPTFIDQVLFWALKLLALPACVCEEEGGRGEGSG